LRGKATDHPGSKDAAPVSLEKFTVPSIEGGSINGLKEKMELVKREDVGFYSRG